MYERSQIEAEFFHTCFGHTMHNSRLAMDVAISADCKASSAESTKNRVTSSFDDMNHQYLSIFAKHFGWMNHSKQR